MMRWPEVLYPGAHAPELPPERGRPHSLEPEASGTTAAKGETRGESRPLSRCQAARDSLHRARLKAAAQRCKDRPVAKKAIEEALDCGGDFALFQPPAGPVQTVQLWCDRKHCRHCAREWSRRLFRGLRPRAQAVPHEDLRHVVLTIRNAPPGQLAIRFAELREVFREWRNQGRRAEWWQPRGYAAKYELTRSPADGSWHPHVHILLDQPGGLNLRGESPARDAWRRLTSHTSAGESPNLWITGIRSAGVAGEVAKYAAKPLELSGSLPAIIEAAEATHGLRWLSCQGTLAVRIGRNARSKGGLFLGTLRQALKDRCTALSYQDALAIFAGLSHNEQAAVSPALARHARGQTKGGQQDNNGQGDAFPVHGS